MESNKYCVAFLALLLLEGCAAPTTPQQVRALAKDGNCAVDKFVVKRPYAAVTHDIKQKSDKCLNKTYRRTVTYQSGFLGTSQTTRDDGAIRYISMGNITPTHAEFYTKSRTTQAGKSEEPTDKFVYYVADVTPKSGSETAITLYYFDYDVYRWGHDAVKAWAQGEDAGCPIITTP